MEYFCFRELKIESQHGLTKWTLVFFSYLSLPGLNSTSHTKKGHPSLLLPTCPYGPP